MDPDPVSLLLKRTMEIKDSLEQQNKQLHEEIEQLHQLIKRLQLYVTSTTKYLTTRESLFISTPERQADLDWKPDK